MARSLLNKVPDDLVLSRNLSALFNTYGSLDPSNPSSYFLLSKDPPRSVTYFIAVCHASLRAVQHNTWDSLVTAVPKSDELSLSYQRMLIQGPFRGLSDLINLEKSGDHYYIRCNELDKWPANVLSNYCIATRVPIEYPHYLPLWEELVKLGYDSTLAFLLSSSTMGEHFNGNRTFPQLNHMWTDPSSDWRAIVHGEMANLTESFRSKPSASFPCNVIWGTRPDYVKYVTMGDEEISQHLNLPIVPPKAPPRRDKVRTLYQEIIAQQQAAGAEPGAIIPLHWANPQAEMANVALNQAWHNAVALQPANPAAEILLGDWPAPVAVGGPQPPNDFDFDEFDGDDFPEIDDDEVIDEFQDF